MRVRIKIFSLLREKLGWSEKNIELDTDKATLADVLRLIPELFTVVFADTKGERVRDDVTVLVNGINVKFLREGLTEIKDGDVISIFPPGGGG